MLKLLVEALGAVIVTVVLVFRANYMLREKAIALNDQKFKILMEILKADNASEISPLHLELAFQRAFGHPLTSDEIVFALDRRNTSNLLYDMWHGRAFASLNADKTGFVVKRERYLSLKTRERICAAIFSFVLIPGFLAALVCVFVEPGIGLVFLAEMCAFLWMFFSTARSIACARRLIELERAGDLRTCRKRQSPVVPIVLHEVDREAQPKRRTRNKSNTGSQS